MTVTWATPLALAMMAVGIGTDVAAETYVGLNRNAEQVWFQSSPITVSATTGEVQAHVYQVFRDAQTMGKDRIQFADFLLTYDCKAGKYHPQNATFYDEQFKRTGSAEFADAKPADFSPKSSWGPGYACDPSTAPADRRISANDWQELAARVYFELKR